VVGLAETGDIEAAAECRGRSLQDFLNYHPGRPTTTAQIEECDSPFRQERMRELGIESAVRNFCAFSVCKNIDQHRN